MSSMGKRKKKQRDGGDLKQNKFNDDAQIAEATRIKVQAILQDLRTSNEKAINLQAMEDHFHEDLCFFCKEGGTLLLCDERDCPKAYHIECICLKDTCIPAHWTCGVHSCFICDRSSEFNCLCCTKALCRQCIVRGEFVQLKEKYGLCSVCLKLALYVEQDMDANFDMVYISLFRNYWKIVNEKESITLENLRSADVRMKLGQWFNGKATSFKRLKRSVRTDVAAWGSIALTNFLKDVSIAAADEGELQLISKNAKALRQRDQSLPRLLSLGSSKASGFKENDNEILSGNMSAKWGDNLFENIVASGEGAVGDGAGGPNQCFANRHDTEMINEFKDILDDKEAKKGSIDKMQTQSPNLFPSVNSKRKGSGAANVHKGLDGAMHANEDPTLVQALEVLQVMTDEMEEINQLTPLYHFSQQFLRDKNMRKIFLRARTNQIRLASLQYNYQEHLRTRII